MSELVITSSSTLNLVLQSMMKHCLSNTFYSLLPFMTIMRTWYYCISSLSNRKGLAWRLFLSSLPLILALLRLTSSCHHHDTPSLSRVSTFYRGNTSYASHGEPCHLPIVNVQVPSMWYPVGVALLTGYHRHRGEPRLLPLWYWYRESLVETLY